MLIVELEEKPVDTKHRNTHALRKQQRRHTIADQSSLSFIKPIGSWKQSRRQSMFKNTLPTVRNIYSFYIWFEFSVIVYS